MLDTVIGLRQPEDYRPQEGARVEIHIEKSRGHIGDAGKPFEASLVSTPDRQGLMWTNRNVRASHLDEAAALFRNGCTVRAVAAQLGIDKSSAGRLRQRAQVEGLLDASDDGPEAGGEDEPGTLH